DGTGPEHVAELETVAPTRAAARIVETHPRRSPALHLVLLQGVPKGMKMDGIVRMGTEVGVSEFIPFTSARTVAAGRGSVKRWQRIAVVAERQGSSSDVTGVHGLVALLGALGMVTGWCRVILG